jgi:hypothetical protein
MAAQTKADLVELLDAAGVPYPSGATKAELLVLVDEHAATISGSVPAEPASAPASARPVWEGGESRREYQARLQQWLLDNNQAR